MRLTKLLAALAALSIPSFAIFSDALFAQRKVDPARAARADIPSRNVADPRALEEQLKSVASKVTPCAVAVGGGRLGGSRVIVSADGLVLTQSHCAPDATVTIGLPGGTEEIADVVGRDEVFDLGLLKLRKPGPYPHVDFAETMPKLESWIVTAGYPYPLGYQKGRPPEVRLGKLLYASEIDFLTDCPQDGGDSGAPYFDLNGRLIGIVDGSTYLSDLLFPDFSWNLGRPWMRGTPLKEAHSRFERMARGEKNIRLSRGELSFTDRGMRIRFSDLIPKERHSHGKKTLEAFGEANAGVKASVVEVLDGNEPAALGAVVDADGLVLTKPTSIPNCCSRGNSSTFGITMNVIVSPSWGRSASPRRVCTGMLAAAGSRRVFRTARVDVPRSTRPVGVHATHEFALCSSERCT
ncbi:MAG: serine protease [Isosphaeraceae bacterium]